MVKVLRCHKEVPAKAKRPQWVRATRLIAGFPLQPWREVLRKDPEDCPETRQCALSEEVRPAGKQPAQA